MLGRWKRGGRGADFRKHAFARGAAATLVPDDAFSALAAIGRAVRDRASARVVGITGSMGKTSTKDLLAALCAPSARTIANEGNFNNEIGVPLTLCRLEPDSEVCILELAMRGLGQIAELCEIARPDIGVVTNVGPVHLELVESLDGVIRAKSELVDALPPGGVAIVPKDFPVEREDIRVIRLGEPAAEVSDGRTSVGGVSFNFVAEHQAENLRWLGAECQANANLLRPLSDGVRDDAIDPHHRQQQRDDREDAEQDQAEPMPADQRRLQRESGVDASGARLPRCPRGRPPPCRDPRRHGGARPDGSGVPPGGRRGGRRAGGR